MISPSRPLYTPRGSLSTATRSERSGASTTPTNFNAIGGSGGGGGGPLGVAGTEGEASGVSGSGGRGGAAFGLNRNRFRFTSPGRGRCASSASRWTSGAVMTSGVLPACVLARGLLDVRDPEAVGPERSQYVRPIANTTARTASRIFWRRSGSIRPQTVIR
jgi:hypothetical protein